MKKQRNPNAVEVKDLEFAYGKMPVLSGLNLELPAGARCLVLGANGVGKSTLLRILAGKHMFHTGEISVLGENPFSSSHSPRELTLVADRFPFNLDIPVRDLIGPRPAVDAAFERELLGLLGIDPDWRMHRVSNGQRRRVDLFLSLRHQPKVVLLDEVTSDLDILTRQELLSWLKRQSKSKPPMTVIFATHILDGMFEWASHVLFLSPLRVRYAGVVGKFPGHTLKWMKEDARHGKKA